MSNHIKCKRNLEEVYKMDTVLEKVKEVISEQLGIDDTDSITT